MRKKGKILSIVLSVMMLMQVFAITSFAAEAPGNVHWATENDEFKSSDADLVFELVDGIELYKITLYKNGEMVDCEVCGISSDDIIWYHEMEWLMDENGPGSYKAVVETVQGDHDDYEGLSHEETPTLATAESDILIWNGSVKKEEVKTETSKTEVLTTSIPTQTTTNSTTKNLPEGDKTLRDFPQIVRINDIRNNDMFEIVEEYTVPQKIVQLYDSRIEFASNIIAALPIKEMSYTYNIFDKSYETTYYDGLNVFDIRDMQFSSIGYTEELNKLRVFEKDSKTGNIKLYDGISKYYEYGYINTQNWAYDTVNNKLYIYDFLSTGKYKIDYIRNDGEFFLFEVDEADYFTKAYKVKVKNAPIVSVCYAIWNRAALDASIERDYDGKIAFDQVPVIENGRTLVPLRAIFEKIGATVEWDGNTQTVKATKGDISISLTINNTTAYKNGQAITLDVPAKILNGRTLVPVRFIADCFGVNVEWIQETKTVYLSEN